MSRTKARGNVLDAITLPLSGAVMSGDIDMTLTNIVNLLNPIDAQDAATKKYVDDQILALVVPIINSLVPAGTIIAWGSEIPPTDWVICNGQSLDSVADTSLALLFSTIGITYGGTGAADFQVPDLKGRLILGEYTAGTATNRVTSAPAQTIGAVDGIGVITLTAPQMPNHNHSASAVSDGSHSHGGTTGNGGNHTHSVTATNDNLDGDGSPNVPGYVIKNGSPGVSGLVGNVPNHKHSLNMNGKSDHTHNLNIANDGGGSYHENTAPFQTVNYIIKVV